MDYTYKAQFSTVMNVENNGIQIEKYTQATQTVHNTPVMTILKGYYS